MVACVVLLQVFVLAVWYVNLGMLWDVHYLLVVYRVCRKCVLMEGVFGEWAFRRFRSTPATHRLVTYLPERYRVFRGEW